MFLFQMRGELDTHPRHAKFANTMTEVAARRRRRAAAAGGGGDRRSDHVPVADAGGGARLVPVV